MTEIERLKTEVFDILAEQSGLQMRVNELERVKQDKVNQLNVLVAAGQKTAQQPQDSDNSNPPRKPRITDPREE